MDFVCVCACVCLCRFLCMRRRGGVGSPIAPLMAQPLSAFPLCLVLAYFDLSPPIIIIFLSLQLSPFPFGPHLRSCRIKQIFLGGYVGTEAFVEVYSKNKIS